MFLVFIPKKLLFCQTDRTPVVTIKAIKITEKHFKQFCLVMLPLHIVTFK